MAWHISQSEHPDFKSGPVLQQPQRGLMPPGLLIEEWHAHLAPRGTESAHSDSSGGLLLPLYAPNSPMLTNRAAAGNCQMRVTARVPAAAQPMSAATCSMPGVQRLSLLLSRVACLAHVPDQGHEVQKAKVRGRAIWRPPVAWCPVYSDLSRSQQGGKLPSAQAASIQHFLSACFSLPISDRGAAAGIRR